jgi:hypothetical protein
MLRFFSLGIAGSEKKPVRGIKIRRNWAFAIRISLQALCFQRLTTPAILTVASHRIHVTPPQQLEK